jgi:arabinogalactan oligomer / maltooligosaccharide transport system permease protein
VELAQDRRRRGDREHVPVGDGGLRVLAAALHRRRVGLLTILLVQMFPQLLANVAIFLFLVNVRELLPGHRVRDQLGLFLVYLGGALGTNTWLMKGFFDTIPKELDESALVDGATHGQIFTRIILPLSLPILVVAGLLSFIFLFNEFILASVLLGQADANQTLATGLYRFIDQNYGSSGGRSPPAR